MPDVVAKGIQSIDTGVELDSLRAINEGLLSWPEGFNVYPKVKKILERRKDALEENGKIEWALAESLAFASILQEGTPIRLTGQDSQRGTFAHRHIVLHDTDTNETYSPLHRYQTSTLHSLFITVRYQKLLLLVTSMVITYSLQKRLLCGKRNMVTSQILRKHYLINMFQLEEQNGVKNLV